MPDHKNVYSRYGSQYERLVAREDYQGRILEALQQITPLEGKDIVELGAGTGRLTCLLAPRVRSIQAFDLSPHMLQVAVDKLTAGGLRNWTARVADHRAIPLPARSADVAISGWSICYLVDWNREHWREEVEKAMAEMQRLLRPGGVIILLETLGTGFETPHPPDHLTAYYEMLEQTGFTRTWIRTDYRFESTEEAVDLVQFFFGDELAERVKNEYHQVLPECTGIWVKRPHPPSPSPKTLDGIQNNPGL